MQVYLLNLQEFSTQAIEHLASSLPPHRAAAAARCRRAIHRAQTVLGYALVRYATEHLNGKTMSEDWQHGEHGKPHWKGGMPFFNLTHTAHCVAVVVSDTQEVGIDAEIIKPQRDGFAARYFTQEEQQMIAATAQPEEALIRLWSAKEAEGKRLGIGLLQMRRQTVDSVCSRPIVVNGVPHWLSVSPAKQFPPVIFVNEWDLV